MFGSDSVSSYPEGGDNVGRRNNVLLSASPRLHAKTKQQEVEIFEASEFLSKD